MIFKKSLKGVSKSRPKHIKFDEYRKRLNGDEQQKERNNIFLKSVIHGMDLQKNLHYLSSMIQNVI